MTSLLGRMQQQRDPDEEPEKRSADNGDSGIAGHLLDVPGAGGAQKMAYNTLGAVSAERAVEIKQAIQGRMLKEIQALQKTREKEMQEAPTPGASRLGRVRRETGDEMQEKVRDLFNVIVAEEGFILNRKERAQIFEQVVADILGYGPLEQLLADESTTDILVVGHDKVFVERNGHILRTNIVFDNEDHLMHIIDRILVPMGRRVDETSPMVDARLPDGSRVNVVIPPLALDGPYLTIRKFATIPYGPSDLIQFGTASPEIFEFLNAAVAAGFNIIVSGGSSSGKTTLLNVLSSFIPDEERVVTIENAAELQLQQDHVVRLETRPANIEGEGELDVRNLVINSLRMRPDRIIVGEVREAEAIDLLQAMNTGHEGSMGTLHANSPADALARLETMCMMSGMRMPVRAIREQVSSAINLVVHMARLRDGSRRILQIAEVNGMEGESITMTDLFIWEQIAIDDHGKITGRFSPTGLVPRMIDKINDAGIRLPMSLFGVVSRS